MVVVVALALTVVVACLALTQGDFPLSVGEVVTALTGGGDPSGQYVVRELRLPRILVGALVGAAFGMSGAVSSAVLRNPLATPDILGVTAGASTAAVAVILLGLSTSVPLAAIGGGVLVALLVAALSWRDGFSGPRLVLVGIGLGAAASASTSYLLVRAEITDAQRAVLWLTGSLNGRGWAEVRPLVVAVVVLTLLAAVLSRSLITLRLGDDLARSLGTRVALARAGLVLVAVGLAAAATAAAGPIVFVALVSPQIALRLARTPGPPPVTSAAVGALLVVAADLVGRTAIPMLGGPPAQLPVGAVTAIVGAPVLLALLRRSARGRVR